MWIWIWICGDGVVNEKVGEGWYGLFDVGVFSVVVVLVLFCCILKLSFNFWID